MTNAVAYVRLSVHRGEADTSVAPEEQKRRIEAYCQAQGWHLVDVVSDLDVSGSEKGLGLDRPGIRRIRALLPEVDRVVALKIDRFARDVVVFRALADEVAEHGAALVAIEDHLDMSDNAGRLVATVIAAFAEAEAAEIAARVRRARGALARLGRFAGGRVPYGYDTAPALEGPGRRLVPNEVEGAVLAEAAARILRGEALTSICRDLNARGVATPRSGARLARLATVRFEERGEKAPADLLAKSGDLGSWHPSTLRAMLTADVVVGRIVRDGAPVRDERGLPVAAFEPALDPNVWHLLREHFAASDKAHRARLAEASATGESPATLPPARRRESRAMLAGLAYCGSCNSRMRTRGTGARAVYFCPASSEGRPCDRGVTMLAERFDALVEAAFLARLGTTPVMVRQSTADEAAVARLADTEDALDAVLADLREVTDEREEERLFARRRELRADLDGLRAAAETATLVLVDSGETFADVWGRSDALARRALLRDANVDHVVLRPGVGRSTKPDPSRIELVYGADPHDDHDAPFYPREESRILAAEADAADYLGDPDAA